MSKLKTHNEKESYYDKHKRATAYYTTCGRLVYGLDRISSNPTCGTCWFQRASGIWI